MVVGYSEITVHFEEGVKSPKPSAPPHQGDGLYFVYSPERVIDEIFRMGLHSGCYYDRAVAQRGSCTSCIWLCMPEVPGYWCEERILIPHIS